MSFGPDRGLKKGATLGIAPGHPRPSAAAVGFRSLPLQTRGRNNDWFIVRGRSLSLRYRSGAMLKYGSD